MARTRLSVLLLLLTALFAYGCKQAEPGGPPPVAARPPSDPTPAAGEPAAPTRKVVRRATLSLEVRGVSAAHGRAVAIAEKHGGHLLASSRDEARGEATTRPASSLSLRVPSAELAAVLAELSRLAAGALSERITADDVTDEVVDLEARLRNQRRLEEQLLTLLQSARDVEAALKVHQELSAARGEIERLEGRRTLLERTVSFATIELSLSELPVAQVSTGFLGDSLARAEHDAVRVGQGIVTGVIRLCGVLLPVALLIVLPSLAALWLLHRWALRRRLERGTFPST